jgi:hypothetical protein
LRCAACNWLGKGGRREEEGRKKGGRREEEGRKKGGGLASLKRRDRLFVF